MNDIVFVCQNLAKWAKDEAAPDINLANKLLSPRIRKEPLGCVLIIGYFLSRRSPDMQASTDDHSSTFNFPIQLAIGPIIGAIAAGNTAVLKPSENAPACATMLQRLFQTSLDPSCYRVVQGAIPETTALLDQKWDKIFYTGGATVGKIIAKKAAETLTPVTLELGGRNPAIVTKNADARLAARRLLWGKILNAGQVCVSQNYTTVDEEILPAFLSELEIALQTFYPNGAKSSPDYGRIVNARSFHRIKSMLDSTDGKILFGGETDEATLFIAPTVIQVSSVHDSLIKDESFGPLMPILPVKNLDEAIRIANAVDSTPLGLYSFGTTAETNRILSEVRSGGASVNDAFMHGSLPTMSFGGVGDSGQGAYRGKASFDNFTHRRSVTTTPGWMEWLLDVRYPPYAGKLAKFRKMADLKPDFDRQGNSTGWFAMFGL